MTSLKPPFKAKNMNELFKRVSKGLYSPIPTIYSKDLSSVIGSLLKKNPVNRPSAEEILSNILPKQKLEKYVSEYTQAYEDEKDDLCNTIKLPTNGKLKQIIPKLPKSNYGDLSTQSSGKSQAELQNRSLSLTRNSNTMNAILSK